LRHKSTRYGHENCNSGDSQCRYYYVGSQRYSSNNIRNLMSFGSLCKDTDPLTACRDSKNSGLCTTSNWDLRRVIRSKCRLTCNACADDCVDKENDEYCENARKLGLCTSTNSAIRTTTLDLCRLTCKACDNDPKPSSTTCQTLAVTYGCPTELNELDVPGLTSKTPDGCKEACEKLKGKGTFCCEWQTDWRRCVYQTKDSNREFLGSHDRKRYAGICRSSGPIQTPSPTPSPSPSPTTRPVPSVTCANMKISYGCPYGSNTLTKSSGPYMSIKYANQFHDSFWQTFMDGGSEKFRIFWNFKSGKKTLLQ